MSKFTARDFFVQIGAVISFYVSVIAIISIYFEVINFAYPPQTPHYESYTSSISLAVAMLIVFFPIFILLSVLMSKHYENDPDLKNNSIRKWQTYLTLFITGALVSGNLVTICYRFLDGQDITTGFLLKSLTLLMVSSCIFIYHHRDIKNSIVGNERYVWRYLAIFIVITSIVLGFLVIGTPKEQRAMRNDVTRVNDLRAIKWQIVYYWQRNEKLPENLAQLNDPISEYKIPFDPKTGSVYEYSKDGSLSFSLCANFESENKQRKNKITDSYSLSDLGEDFNFGKYIVGRNCFKSTIDPLLYPPLSNK